MYRLIVKLKKYCGPYHKNYEGIFTLIHVKKWIAITQKGIPQFLYNLVHRNCRNSITQV